MLVKELVKVMQMLRCMSTICNPQQEGCPRA